MNSSTLGSPPLAKPSHRCPNGLAAVAKVLGLFWVIAQALHLFGDPTSPACTALKNIKRPLGIAIVGDSRAHAGLSPARLGEAIETPVNIYNFAVDGTDALHHTSFVVNGLLNQKVPPAVILWAPNPLSFNEERKNNRVEQLTLSDLPLLWRNRAPFEMLLDIATAELFGPYRQRVVLKRVMKNLTDRMAWLAVHVQRRVLKLGYTPLLPAREYLHADRGYAPFNVLRWQDAFERSAADYAHQYRTARLSTLRTEAARDLLRAARRAGVHVVVLELPVAPWFQENLATQDFHRAWRKWVQEIAAAEGADFVCDAAFGSDNHEFGDPGHMHRTAAEAYSEKLGVKLRTIPAVCAALEKAARGSVEGKPN